MIEEAIEVIEPVNTESEIVDMEDFQTNGQIATKAFWYRVTDNSTSHYLTVLSMSSTAARDGIKQQFPNSIVAFLGASNIIMQVNG